MAIDAERGRRRTPLYCLAVLGALFAAPVMLGGCSEIPDAVNPVEWYKGTMDWVVGDDEETAEEKPQSQVVTDRGKPAPGADQPIPNLGTVPGKPKPTSAEQRRQIVSGLVADRDRARYSDEVIRRQGAPVQPRMLARGPGNLAQALGITRELHDGHDLLSPPFSIDASVVDAVQVRSGPRVGVAGVAGGPEFPWRFWLPGEPTVSAFRPGRGAPRS